MKTLQIMKREFMDSTISQRTDKMFNATELLSIYNSNQKGIKGKKVFAEFWSNKGTLEFIKELEDDIISSIGECGNSLHLKTHETSRGNGGGTWMHPYLFVKFAMWLSPKFELQIIKWVYDNLIDFRDQAGDYYKEMASCICRNYEQFYGTKPGPFVYQNEAKFLNNLVYGEYKGGKRNTLNEKQLELLNSLQRLNIKLIESKQFSKEQRRDYLINFSTSFKLINF